MYSESVTSPERTTYLAFSRIVRPALFVGSFGFVVYYAVFRLPYWFPPQQRLVSSSYAFGFSNSVAILAVAGLLAGLTLLFLTRPDYLAFATQPFVSEFSEARRGLLRKVFVIVGLIYAVLTFVMFWYDMRAEPSLMWETRHLIHRMWVMDVYSVQPYTELSAEYGLILTYAPLYAYRLLKPLGASHPFGYFASHLLLNIAGLWCVYYVLSRSRMSDRARIVAFVLLAIAGFAPYMGVNGVLVRYLFPYASLLLGARLIGRLLVSRRLAGTLGAACVAFLLVMGNVLLSPEIGVAFAIAWTTYAALRLGRQPRLALISLLALTLAGLLSWLILPREYYGTFLRFSEGANNLPLLPAPHLILYLVGLFLLIPPLLAGSARKWPEEEAPGVALCGALAVLCLVMAPGALGRCDPPHVLLYGMGTTMLLMIQLSRISWRAFAAYAVAYAAVFIVFIEAVNLVVFYGISPETLFSQHPVRNVIHKLRSAKGTTHPDNKTLSPLNRFPRIGLPFATFGDPVVERYVMDRRLLRPEYYVSVVGVYSSPALERKLNDLGKMEYVLVPRKLLRDGKTAPPRDPCAGYRKSLRQWFLFPTDLPCRAQPLDASAVVTSFLASNYTPIEQVSSFVLLRRNSGVLTTRNKR
jgi:hypothetical protein